MLFVFHACFLLVCHWYLENHSELSVFHLESSLAGWMSTVVWTMNEWETWGQENVGSYECA